MLLKGKKDTCGGQRPAFIISTWSILTRKLRCSGDPDLLEERTGGSFSMQPTREHGWRYFLTNGRTWDYTDLEENN